MTTNRPTFVIVPPGDYPEGSWMAEVDPGRQAFTADQLRDLAAGIREVALMLEGLDRAESTILDAGFEPTTRKKDRQIVYFRLSLCDQDHRAPHLLRESETCPPTADGKKKDGTE